MHSPISICGELRCCRGRRVMLCDLLLHTYLGLRRDMNAHYLPSGQERSMRSRQSGSPDSVPTAIKRNSSSNLTCPKASPLLITITNTPNAFALLCPPDEMCNVNLDHPPAHTTKAPKPTYHPPVAKPLVIDQFPSIGKDTRPPFALPFAAADRNARFHQANASISLPIPSLRIPPNRVNASTPPTVHHTAVSV